MKKILTFALFLFLSIALHSQQLYLNPDAGWAFQAFPSKVESFINVKNDNNNTSIQSPEFSMGGGLLANLSVGYFFNDYLGIDFGLQMHFGSKVTFTQETVILNQLEEKEIILKGRRVIIIPSMILKAGSGFLVPYLKLGPSFGFIKQERHIVAKIDTNTGEEFWSYSGPPAIGINAVAGLMANIKENMAVSLSLTCSGMVYRPTKSDRYKKLENKYPLPPGRPYEEHIVFVDWTDDPYNTGPQDPEEPTLMQGQNFAYSNVGINLGVFFFF